MSVHLHRGPGRVALLVVLAMFAIVLPPTAAQAAGGDATFVGRGYGHGRGMGQYGALGYAVNYGWSSAQILDHFYGGTTAGTAGNPEMTVELLGSTGQDTIVTGPGIAINSVAAGDAAVLIRRTATGTFQAYTSPGCGGPWTARAGELGSGLTISTSAAATSLDNLLGVCNGPGKRAYRGTLAVISAGGQQMTINHLPTETYLRGVVPRESPESWGAMGGGQGMQALRAQAVAARSYALAGSRPSGARTCDTTSCQVYNGAGTKVTEAGAWTMPELAMTDTAISGTAGVVRRMSNGAVARTEFSSSTGGHSAGGTFPAVADFGDAVSANPNRVWTAAFSLSDVAARLGTGTIRTIAVTARNGLGADGGRATSVTVTTTSGQTQSFTGADVRARLGLKSDWFSISSLSTAVAQSLVSALYQDLLGRGADPTGLATWTTRLLQGAGQSELVYLLTRSDEYIRLRVAEAYLEVLGRAPEAQGAVNWLRQIRLNRATVDDVQRRFFDSKEFVTISGGTVPGYVATMYQSILMRPASSSEVAAWVVKMKKYGRAWVVNQIWFSREASSVRAGSYYELFLKRAPEPAGRAHWARVLVAQGEGAVRTGIAGSAEYRTLAIVRYP